MADLRVRPAEPADLDRVAELLRGSFEERLRPYLVYAQHGVGAYLAEAAADRDRFVAVDNRSRVGGFAEFRTAADGVFLSYVCVDPPWRERGVARALLAAGLGAAPSMRLDVFAGNAAAEALYERLGFREEGRARWLVRSMPNPADRPVEVPGRAAASERLVSHGFCELRVGGRRLGVIGGAVLRCFELADFADDDLLAGLRATLPGLREAFIIGPDEEGPGETLVVSRRLVAAGPTLRAALGQADGAR